MNIQNDAGNGGDNTYISFQNFVESWNALQNMDTPGIHIKMINWLESKWHNNETRLLVMAFRAFGKSTIIGLFCVWILQNNPSKRILVLSADEALARKMVRNVKRIIERHPLTHGLKPAKPDQWASDRFTINRDTELRDPSMLAKGISANLTGTRADIVICDDVEVPNTSDSAEKRENLRKQLAEVIYILSPNGTQLYTGTPHTYQTIYAENARAELGEDEAFLNGFCRLKIPLLDKNNNSVWPDKYDRQTIAQIKRQTGPNKFARQMMLEPVDISEGHLNPALLNVYEDELHYVKELNGLYIGGRKMISGTAWWDPAFGSARGDASVLAIIFTDEKGALYLQHLLYIKTNPNEAEDEANQQCTAIAAALKQHYVPSVSVEVNGIGKFLPRILRNTLARSRTPCAVEEAVSSRSKDLRILEAFDAVLAARMLNIHRSIYQTPFISEMRDWKTGKSGGKDDGLDAVAGAITKQPVRIERIYGKGGYNWSGTAKNHTAKTDFTV